MWKYLNHFIVPLLQHFYFHWTQNKNVEKMYVHIKIWRIVNLNFIVFTIERAFRLKFFTNDLLFCWKIYCHGNALFKQIYLDFFPDVFEPVSNCCNVIFTIYFQLTTKSQIRNSLSISQIKNSSKHRKINKRTRSKPSKIQIIIIYLNLI